MRRGRDLPHLESWRAKPALREIGPAVRAGHGRLPIRMKPAAPAFVGRALPAIARPRNAETCDDGSPALRSMRRGLDLVHLESRRAKPALREIGPAVRAGHGRLPIRMKPAAPAFVGRALPAIARPRNAETCDDGSPALRSMRRGLDLVHLESRRAKPVLREIELAVRAGHGRLPIRMKPAAPVPVGRALPAIACERSRIFARLSRAGDNVISRFSVESEGDA